jgi:hypothetical protein
MAEHVNETLRTSYEMLARFFEDSTAATPITTSSTFTIAGAGLAIVSGPAGTWNIVADAADFTSVTNEAVFRVELDLHSGGSLGADPSGKREYILPFKPGT